MRHATATAIRPTNPVRVLVEDVPELEEHLRDAAQRARDTARALELVEPAVAKDDHAARARLCRRMDAALNVVRSATPGIEVRVAVAIDLPRPRRPR